MNLGNSILTILISTLILINVSGQKNNQIGYNIEFGLNSSDFEAGLEYVIEYLPKEDYSSFGTSGSPKNGYNINIGTQLALNPSFDLQFQTGYQLYRYEIRGQVYNLRSNINRPLSESIPISIKGNVNFRFWNFGVDLIHNFRKNKNGIVASMGLDYMFNLTPNWDVDWISETGNNAKLSKIPAELTQNENDIIITDFRLGYNFNLKNSLSVIPSFGFHLGLNRVRIDDSQNSFPNAYSINVKLKR